MVYQVEIYPEPSAPDNKKGDIFEDLLRHIMETQRYDVTQRINFTGTEIDLLCEHKDRQRETAIVECKAKIGVNSGDIKNFAFDVLIEKRADYGYFVHTHELHHQAAGLKEQLEQEHPRKLFFWGPQKIIELLEHQHTIIPPTENAMPGLTQSKVILVYSHFGTFWITIFVNGVIPTHYSVSSAMSIDQRLDEDVLNWVTNRDELQGLKRMNDIKPLSILQDNTRLDAVAEIQEAKEWDDYRPVGAKFFVGRSDIRQYLYQFIISVVNGENPQRVFFIEGKSGWGKSSLLAELRDRARNMRNKNTFYVMVVDSRSANSSEFVSLAMAKLVSKAVENGFVPSDLGEPNIVSSFNTLASSEMQDLLNWLKENDRALVLVFDQFEDVFRKGDLFRAFHKLMIDVHEEQQPIIVGFSWKSEIYIPIDNPAYNLWQQARDLADTFTLEEFLGYEVDRVINQLARQSHHQLPSDLKRRLKESSQGFPWFTKKLAIHCYRQMLKGVLPEELVDQNLNVLDLFQDDLESLIPSEKRALELIAERGYNGDPFDVAEVDDKIQESEINSLISKRLIIRSGSKYNVYWDIFRDYLVDGTVPSLGENFLIRQYPTPCIKILEFLLENAPCAFEAIRNSDEHREWSDSTVQNRIRELRYLGAVRKEGDDFTVKPTIENLEDFKQHIRAKLNQHPVVNALRRISVDTITHDDVVKALQENFKGYSFTAKTWEKCASYFTAWLRYSGIDFGHRLADRAGHGTPESFTPQWRPEKDLQLLMSFDTTTGTLSRSRKMDNGLYDLKAMGLITYTGKETQLTKRGWNLIRLGKEDIRQALALLAVDLPKIRYAYEAIVESGTQRNETFESLISPLIKKDIKDISDSYLKVTVKILKAWARFVYEQIELPQQKDLFNIEDS